MERRAGFGLSRDREACPFAVKSCDTVTGTGKSRYDGVEVHLSTTDLAAAMVHARQCARLQLLYIKLAGWGLDSNASRYPDDY